MSALRSSLARDLDHVLVHTENLWKQIRGKRVFITGGTGFFGIWLLESFAWANAKLNLRAEAVVLTRNPAAFRAKAPHLALDPAIRLKRGDVRSFDLGEENCSFIVHAATETDPLDARLPAMELFGANVAATRRVMEFAIHCGAERLLFTSSGAVYGRQPPELNHIPETYAGAPSSLEGASAYGLSKRVSEFLCATAAANSDLGVTIARCFAFVGPHLPLNANYAIGNFIGDALAERSIRVHGDGRPRRSYLYAADLAIWLWTILFSGENGEVYNVGSDADLSIATLASLTAETVSRDSNVVIAEKPGAGPPPRYVPCINRARTQLGLEPWIDLREAIDRTASWHRRI